MAWVTIKMVPFLSLLLLALKKYFLQRNLIEQVQFYVHAIVKSFLKRFVFEEKKSIKKIFVCKLGVCKQKTRWFVFVS